MAKKTKKRSITGKKKGNVFTKLIIILLAIALIVMVAAKFLKPGDDKPKNEEVTTVVPEPASEPTPTPAPEPVKDINANGAWMNDNDQSLIIKDNRYAIYLSGIERDHPIVGEYKVKGNVITFVNKKDPCEGAKGLYEVSFKGKNIVFKCKDDGCSKRRAILLNGWMWLDTDMDDISLNE